VAGKPWFQDYFVRLAFSDQDGTDSFSGRLTKWDKRRVRIDVLNSGGPGMSDYVQSVVRRLNRMQSATRFVVADGTADITIKYVSHAEYVRTIGEGSVGNCETRFYSATPGLVEAAITVDAGALRTPAERKPVVIHELTHALGFRGHFREPRYETRSVLYYAASRTTWSQDDGAAIRIMYSSSIRNGMSESAARKALRRIPT
jgi:predicted Zn-dependent protease